MLTAAVLTAAVLTLVGLGKHPHILDLLEFCLNTDASCALLKFDYVVPACCNGKVLSSAADSVYCVFRIY